MRSDAANRRASTEAALDAMDRTLQAGPIENLRVRRPRNLPRGHVMVLLADADGNVTIRRAPGRGDFFRRIFDAVTERFAHLPAPGASPLTEREKALLRRGGVPARSPRLDPIQESAARFAGLLAGSLSVQAAAKVLGVNGSRVRQRLIARTLFGVKLDGEWLVPDFQFHAGREVPGLSRVLPLLPADSGPLAVRNWLTLPCADLEGLSPIDWLLGGRPASRVADLARNPALP